MSFFMAHDDIERIGVGGGLRGAVMGFDVCKMTRVLKVTLHEFNVLLIIQRTPDRDGFGGEHAVGEENGK